MFKLDDKTKQKIVDKIYVIEDDDNSGKRNRFKEIKLKYNNKSIFNKLKLYLKN